MLRFFDRLNLSPSERRLVVVIATVAFLVLNYWLVWPRFDDWRQIREDMDSMQLKRDLYEREIARRPQYELTLRRLQAEGSVLPPGEERIQFRRDMEILARDVGIIVPRWSQVLPERGSGPGTNAFFETISLTMNQASGTEAQFVDFLYRVGASNSTIRVKELSLAPGAFDNRSQGRTNLVASSIKLVASVQKASTNAPPNPTAAQTPPRASTTGTTTVNASAGAGRTNVPIPTRVLSNTNAAAGRPPPGS